MWIARLKQKLERFGNLGLAEQWLLLRAAAWLLVARIGLAVMPFSRLSAKLSAESTAERHAADPGLLQQIGDAVRIAANHVPWRADCFPQSIAARMLLKRQGLASTIHFGVERQGKEDLSGHAWLTCGDTVVTGGTELDRYTELHRPGT